MIKNGRPYSNENGALDITLFTDKMDVKYRAVEAWIKDNIRKSRSISCYSSYGLKHILNHDTGIYLTNNEIKDAMLLAGYHPVNCNELNWRYRIILKREINDKSNPFCRWATKYIDEDSPRGNFVKDMMDCFDFPIFAEHSIIERYLFWRGACEGAMDALEELWEEYSKENNTQ